MPDWRLVAFFTLVAILLGISSSMASQSEYISDERPAPGSVKEERDPISTAFEKEEKRPSFFPKLKQRLDTLRPFWRDTQLSLKVRSYYFNRDNEGAGINKAWALGGALKYESGWWKNRFQLGLVGYTSQKLYGPEDSDGTQLLKPDQESFSVLGQAYVATRILDDIHLRLFRQTFNLPYVNKQDSRMVPNTFEAFLLRGKSVHNTDFIVGHVTKMKKRNASKFEYMSEAAGFNKTNEGLTLAGARYSFREGINIGAVTEYGWDLWNTVYAEGNATLELSDRLGLKVSAQYTDQRSTGDELDGDFSTYAFGGKIAVSYLGAILTLAVTSTDNERGTQSPFGGHPGFTSLMIKDFNRAGENAFLVGLSSDFSSLELTGLSAFINYARGNTRNSGMNASPDQEEFDITVDYHFSRSPLKGLWLRFRAGFLDQEGPGSQDVEDFRIILNYEIPIL